MEKTDKEKQRKQNMGENEKKTEKQKPNVKRTQTVRRREKMKPET